MDFTRRDAQIALDEDGLDAAIEHFGNDFCEADITEVHADALLSLLKEVRCLRAYQRKVLEDTNEKTRTLMTPYVGDSRSFKQMLQDRKRVSNE